MVLSIAAGLLASVFGLSGVSKVRRPVAAALAMRQFGVTRGIRARNGSLLGHGELVLAGLIAFSAPTFVPFALAAALLATFLFLIVRSLLMHDCFACACFGDTETPLSIITAVRTGGLLVVSIGAILAAIISPAEASDTGTRIYGLLIGCLAVSLVALAEGLAASHPFAVRLDDDV